MTDALLLPDPQGRSAEELVADARARRAHDRIGEAVLLGHLALRASRAAGPPPHTFLARTHLFLSDCMAELGYRAMERIHAKEAYLEYTRVGDAEGVFAGAFLSQLGRVAMHGGDYVLAAYYFGRALAAQEAARPADNNAIGHAQLDLAELSIVRAQFVAPLGSGGVLHVQAAERALERAISIVSGTPLTSGLHVRVLEVQALLLLRGSDHLPPEHDQMRNGLLNAAEQNLRKALELRADKAGEVAGKVSALNLLMAVLTRAGRFLDANAVNEQILDLGERIQRGNPEIALNMMLLASRQHAIDTVLKLSGIIMTAEEAAVSELTSYTGEAVALAGTEQLRLRSMRCLALLAKEALRDDRAASGMLEIVLRRKAIVADAETGFWRSLHQRPDADLEHAGRLLITARDRLSSSVVRGVGSGLWELMAEVERREEILLVETQARSFFRDPSRVREREVVKEFGEGLLQQARPWDAVPDDDEALVRSALSIGNVAAGLPRDSVMVEFTKIDEFDVSRDVFTGGARYWSFLLRPNGTVRAFDLGDAATLEREVTSQLQILLTSDKLSHEPQLRATSRLYELVWSHIAGELGDTLTVIVSPDGVLAAVPFGALLFPGGGFLVERHTLHQVVTGRDLLGDKSDAKPEAGRPAVVADPDYDYGGGTDSTTLPSKGIAGSVPPAIFTRLKRGAEELEVLRHVLGPRLDILSRERASEAQVRALRHPRLLHCSTHGIFDRDRSIDTTGLSEEDAVALSAAYVRHVRTLSRSGLALTGANVGMQSLQGDGFLTAYDVVGMDLFGTDLVVLSACESGLGSVLEGEGVLGLGRSFRIAGARNVVMSLWRLSETEALLQLRAFYEAYEKGVSPVIALRDVQRARVRHLRKVLGHEPPPALWAALFAQGTTLPVT